MKRQRIALLSSLFLILALLGAGCTPPAPTPPPTSTRIPLMNGAAQPARAATIVEALSTPIAAFTPAPPSPWTGLSAWSLASVARAEAAPTSAPPTESPTESPTASPTDTPTAAGRDLPAGPPISPLQEPATATQQPAVAPAPPGDVAQAVTPTAAAEAQPTATATDAPPTPTATDMPTVPVSETTTSGETPGGLPLLLLSVTPEDGAAWRGEAVVFAFDNPLDPAGSGGLSIEPRLEGAATVQGATLTFTPTGTLQPETRYRFTLGPKIRSAAGQPLAGELTVDLVSPAPFAVTGLQPADGSQEVAADSPIVVIFNQPVVPLSGIDDQSGLPNPLTIEPVVAGSGSWVNTSVYRFQPEQGLAGATAYTVRVSGIRSLAGDPLAGEPVIAGFSTAAPVVIGAMPEGVDVPPDALVSLFFSQPMEQAGTQAAFRLLPSGGDGAPVSGTFAWNQKGDAFNFTPDAPLDFGATYAILMASEARALSGGGSLRQAWRQQFTVVGLPAISGSEPQDGRDAVAPESGVTVRFSGHLSVTTVLENVTISPLLSSTTVYSYFSPYSNELFLNWEMQPRTPYTVTLGGAIADIYGNRMGGDQAIHFVTGDRAPLLQLDVPRFTHFSAYTDSRVSLLYRNLPALDVALYGLPEREVLRLLSQSQWEIWHNYQHPNPQEFLVWQRSIETSAGLNELGRQVIRLTDSRGERLPTGVYLLQVALPPSSDPNAERFAQVMIVLSNDNLLLKRAAGGDSLAWQTDLRTGAPVAAQPVRFWEESRTVGEGETDGDGLAAAPLALNRDQPWLPVIAISGAPGDEHFALTASGWEDGIAAWQWGLATNLAGDEVRTAFYTDRPIYRPGQTVYWKGIVRRIADEAYQLPPEGLPVWVTLRDDRGNVLVDKEFPLSAHGTIHGELALADGAATGYYSAELRVPLGGERMAYGGAGFQVAEYRAPEFEISVSSQQPAYVQGDTVEIAIEARYFSGGPLADAPVTWRLLAEPYAHTWADAPAGRYYSFDPVQLDDAGNPFGGFSGGLVQEGNGVTDGEGLLLLRVPAELAQANRSQTWTFDVTVQSPSNQFVSGRTSLPIHRSNLYIGVSPRQYVGAAGQEVAFDLVSLTPDNQPVADAALDVVVYDYRWNSVYAQAANGSYYWETSVEKTPVYTGTAATDGDGVGEFLWTPERGGQYLIALSGQDSAGNPAAGGVFVWVSSGGGDFIAWPRDNNDRLELVADKKGYAPGDTARVLIPSPFSGPVYALITLERGGILERSVRLLESNSETLEIPIESAHIPNLYVSVVLVKGVDETNPTPALRLGYALLPVDASERALTIGIEPSVAQARPGATVAYSLTVTNHSGAPVVGAELSAALVDKAVLSLASGDNRSLLDQFYYQLPLGVATSALLTINQDRINQQLSEGGKGGGGGGDGGGLSLRQNFADLAAWRAVLLTDVAGRATFTVTLPDNLTTWRLAVRGVTDDTQVGDAFHDLTATKELLLRPILPRFFSAGDRVRIGVLAQNTTNQALGAVDLRVDVRGADFIGGNDPAQVELDGSGQAELYRVIEVGQEAEQVEIVFSAVAAGQEDGVKISLPVQRYETPEVVGTAGTVPAGGRLEAIRVPAAATDSGDLTVVVEPSLAAGMLEGLDYLKHYPYECVEQTVSRFLPNLVTALALQKLQVENPALAENLAFQLGVGLQKLVNWQNPDGGWGWWSDLMSDRFVTSYVLWSLWTAQEAGYPVPANTLADAIFFLEQNWVAPAQTDDAFTLNQMAFAHFVLAEMGEGDPGRMSTLYEQRERMDIFGRALLALALDKSDVKRTDSRVQTLLDDIARQAQLSAGSAHWQEKGTDWWSMNTDLRTTAIVLHAFTRLRAKDPLTPMAVRWLMNARQDGRWATTQENAWSIIALSGWMEVSGELEGNYEWEVTLNGETLGAGRVERANVDEKQVLVAKVADLLRYEANALAFRRSNESGQMYYSAHLRYFLDATAIAARERGLVVNRRILAEDGRPAAGAAVGDVLSVTVSLNVPTDAHYLLLEVPIPAGTEPIDPRLLTTSNEFAGPELGMEGMAPGDGFWWRQWVPSHTDIRDEKVALFADYLAAGTYEYTFLVRAAIPGEYRVLPARAELMYYPDVWGRSSGGLFSVTD